ncbi:MAG: radical SAM protein [Candidatus Hadarchaeales archaeon]
MSTLRIPPPFSCGLFLTYRCTGECRHCMYACSPRRGENWIDPVGARKVLTKLASSFREQYPPGFSRVGVNLGLHFTGGEPFLNFPLLRMLVGMAKGLEIPATFVETNAHWCAEEEEAREKLLILREEGLDGLLVSVNPFTLEHVPFERARLAVKVGREIFGGNLLVYQEGFFNWALRRGIRGTLRLERLLELEGEEILAELELLPRGRFPFRLGHLCTRYPAEHFLHRSCLDELTRSWHVHVDNYFNYLPGYCGGISLGDARKLEFPAELELEDFPVIKALTRSLGDLLKLGGDYGYREREEGYVSACHLCADIRKHLVEQTKEFRELGPLEFYAFLEPPKSKSP